MARLRATAHSTKNRPAARLAEHEIVTTANTQEVTAGVVRRRTWTRTILHADGRLEILIDRDGHRHTTDAQLRFSVMLGPETEPARLTVVKEGPRTPDALTSIERARAALAMMESGVGMDAGAGSYADTLRAALTDASLALGGDL
jgi:hypothetical protein